MRQCGADVQLAADTRLSTTHCLSRSVISFTERECLLTGAKFSRVATQPPLSSSAIVMVN
jgi:hypothetical protein